MFGARVETQEEDGKLVTRESGFLRKCEHRRAIRTAYVRKNLGRVMKISEKYSFVELKMLGAQCECFSL